MKRLKFIIIIAALLITGFVCFALPKPKNESLNILPSMKIPESMKYWRSIDVSSRLNLQDSIYNFVSGVIARQYVSDLGDSLLLLVLDAGNFHHPKVCFKGSGFLPRPIDDIEMNAAGRKFKAHALFMGKGKESTLVVYWITINGKSVDWTEQKIKQLFYSMLNKKKIGLMGRLDIPARENNIESAVKLAQSFIRDLSQHLPAEQADYLFGKSQ